MSDVTFDAMPPEFQRLVESVESAVLPDWPLTRDVERQSDARNALAACVAGMLEAARAEAWAEFRAQLLRQASQPDKSAYAALRGKEEAKG